MICKDCIHDEVCDSLIESGCPFLDGKYPADKYCFKFKNKADIVEVVRCKDCIFYFEGFMVKPTCRLQDKFMVVEANHYCSYGKKVE